MCLVRHVDNSLLNQVSCSSGGFNGESLRHMSEVHLMGLASTVPEGKRPLGRPRRRWLDNIRIDLQEVGCGLDWAGPG